MGKLDYAVCYLSGSMEFALDHGVAWRRKFISLIKASNLKVDCIDPTNKPGGMDVHIGENKEYQEKLQKEGRWLDLQKYVGTYRRYDLRYVDISDFLVAAVDPQIPQWGTANEIYEAEKQHKPTFFICEGGLTKLPRWLFGVIEIDQDGRSNVYQSVEEVIEALVKLDLEKMPMSDEWVLVRKHIEQSR